MILKFKPFLAKNAPKKFKLTVFAKGLVINSPEGDLQHGLYRISPVILDGILHKYLKCHKLIYYLYLPFHFLVKDILWS